MTEAQETDICTDFFSRATHLNTWPFDIFFLRKTGIKCLQIDVCKPKVKADGWLRTKRNKPLQRYRLVNDLTPWKEIQTVTV